MTTSHGPLMPTFHVGNYAFVDQGDVTVLYDLAAEKPVLYLTAVAEYALARMLIEKTQNVTHSTRALGEALYQEEITTHGRALSLS